MDDDKKVFDKTEAWQGLMNRVDSSGEVLLMLHDDVDCMVPPDAGAYLKRRAEEIKAKLVLLADEIDWLAGVIDGGLGETLLRVHDGLDALIRPDTDIRLKGRAETVKAHLVRLAKEVDDIHVALEPGVGD